MSLDDHFNKVQIATIKEMARIMISDTVLDLKAKNIPLEEVGQIVAFDNPRDYEEGRYGWTVQVLSKGSHLGQGVSHSIDILTDLLRLDEQKNVYPKERVRTISDFFKDSVKYAIRNRDLEGLYQSYEEIQQAVDRLATNVNNVS